MTTGVSANVFTAEEIAERQTGVGASEVAAVMGLSDYETALDVYARKAGLAPESSDSPAKRLGRALEPVVLGLYEEEMDVCLIRGLKVTNPRYPRMFAHPDGVWPGALRGVEAKTVAGRHARKWGEPGTDQIPQGYLIQCHAQMMVGGYEEVHVPVIVAGQRFSIYRVSRSDALVEAIDEAVTRFWRDHILRREPPPSPSPEAVARYLSLAHQRAEGEMREADEEVDRLAWAYRQARQARVAAEEDYLRAENALKATHGASRRRPTA
jgi:putative phage-type endonuclease